MQKTPVEPYIRPLSAESLAETAGKINLGIDIVFCYKTFDDSEIYIVAPGEAAASHTDNYFHFKVHESPNPSDEIPLGRSSHNEFIVIHFTLYYAPKT